MATARKTQAELKAALEGLEAHPDSSRGVREYSKERVEVDPDIGGTDATPGEITSRYMLTLNGDPATIAKADLQEIAAWLISNELDVPSMAPFKARLAVLETHVNSPEANKAYLQQILERSPGIGHDDQEVTDRFNALLAAPPGTIPANRLEWLTERWRQASP